ncbi:hypothetical protein Tco_0158513 [Tanacetum coccineum]
MPRNRLVLTKPKSSAIIVIRHGILLESVDPREIKIVGGEMLGTLGISKMEEDLSYGAKDKVGLGYGDQMNKDSDDECVTTTLKEQEQPSFAFINTVKHVKTPRQIIKEQNTCSQIPKPDKKDYSGLMSKKLGLGYGFTKRHVLIIYKEQKSSIVKNPVFHSQTKHIEIRHHFIRDAYEKKLIQELKEFTLMIM